LNVRAQLKQNDLVFNTACWQTTWLVTVIYLTPLSAAATSSVALLRLYGNMSAIRY
jgi:hypothetical protein